MYIQLYMIILYRYHTNLVNNRIYEIKLFNKFKLKPNTTTVEGIVLSIYSKQILFRNS